MADLHGARCSRWTAIEDAEIRMSYPSYHLLRRRLPHRTMAALKHRARALGVVTQRHVWTGPEVRKLCGAYRDGLRNTGLQSLFPHLTLCQITSKANHLGLTRRRRPLAQFGIDALDSIRSRAQELGMSLVELDTRAGTGRYFQKSSRRLVLGHVASAALVLGGEVVVHWESLD